MGRKELSDHKAINRMLMISQFMCVSNFMLDGKKPNFNSKTDFDNFGLVTCIQIYISGQIPLKLKNDKKEKVWGKIWF